MITIFKEIYQYRELLRSILIKDLKVRYRGAILRIGWAVIIPLATMGIFTFVFTRFVRFDTGGIPYYIFALTGIIPWAFLTASLNVAVESLVANSSLITKVYFPREVFPLSAVFSNLPDFIIGGIILLILIPLSGLPLYPAIIGILLIALIQLIFMIGAAYLLAVGNFFYRDVRYAFQVFVLLWMFLTPIFYPIDILGDKQALVLALNPMASIISSYRFFILKGTFPPINSMLIATGWAIGMFIFGSLIFHRSEYLLAKNV